MAQALITIDSNGTIEDICNASWDAESFCDTYKAGIELDVYKEDGCSYVSHKDFGNYNACLIIEKSEAYQKAYGMISDNLDQPENEV